MSKNSEGGRKSKTEKISVTLSPAQLAEWENEIEEDDWNNRSQYVRAQVESGRKQLTKLHPSDSPRDSGIEQEILDSIPEKAEVEASSEVDPPTRDELIEEVLEPIQQQILEEIDALQTADQIEHSAVHGGYVKK